MTQCVYKDHKDFWKDQLNIGELHRAKHIVDLLYCSYSFCLQSITQHRRLNAILFHYKGHYYLPFFIIKDIIIFLLSPFHFLHVVVTMPCCLFGIYLNRASLGYSPVIIGSHKISGSPIPLHLCSAFIIDNFNQAHLEQGETFLLKTIFTVLTLTTAIYNMKCQSVALFKPGLFRAQVIHYFYDTLMPKNATFKY